MQQRSLNSLFKVKKNSRDDSNSESKHSELSKDTLLKLNSEKKKNIFEDNKRLVFHTATRAKRVSRAEQNSFEEPQQVGKRVKREENSFSKEKDSNNIKSNNIKSSNKNESNSKQKTKLSSEEMPLIPGVLIKRLSRKSKSKSKKKEEDFDFTDEEPKQQNASKSTTYSENAETPKSLSDFTKNMIEKVMKQKREKEEKMKVTGNFNYLNYKESGNHQNHENLTPKKINTNINQETQITPKKIDYGINNINISPNKNDKISTSPAPRDKGKESSSLNMTPSKMKTPPQLKLSLKTLEEISKLKTERQERLNRFKREELSQRNRSESSFSLRFKYEELIKEERELLIPPHYKILYSAFCNLDHTLNLYKVTGRQNRVPIFEDIKATMESTYKQKFEFKTFAQILYVVPHFFIYKWEKVSLTKDEFSLIIDIPKDHQKRLTENYEENFNFIKVQTENYEGTLETLSLIQLEERRKVFKNLLLEIVNEHHKKFLEEINFPKEFDAFKMKTWHHRFNLDHVPAIPIFEILEKPTIQITNIRDFLRETDLKNSLVKRAMEGLNQTYNDTYSNTLHSEEESTTNENSNLSKILSTSFLQKMKAKEEAVNLSKDILEYSTQKNRLKSRVKEFKILVDKIHTLFIMQKKTSVSLNELIQKLQNSSESIKTCFSTGNLYIILENLKNFVFKMKEVFPNWISIIEHSFNGTLVKLEKVDMVDLNKRISDPLLVNEIENSI